MPTYIQKTLGGVARGLKFNLETLVAFQQITGLDPIASLQRDNVWAEVYPYTIKIIHAALISNCKSKKEQPDFTAEDVEKWVGEELALDDLTGILTAYYGIFSQASPTEFIKTSK